MTDSSFTIPQAAWKHAFDDPLDDVKAQSRSFSPLSLLKMAPMIVRIMRHLNKKKEGGFDPMNVQNSSPLQPYNGVPLGGIGGGSINRGWRGDFRRWQLRPGYINTDPVWADQFSLFVQRGELSESHVLYPWQPAENTLTGWNWAMTGEGVHYNGLFPRAWTTYDFDRNGLHLTCRQLSPVIPHNYQETSYPVSEFRWQIKNTGTEEATVALMFTFQNGMGLPADAAGGHHNEPIKQDTAQGEIRGVLLRHAYQQQEVSDTKPPEERKVFEDPLSFAIAGLAPKDGKVTYRTRFETSGTGAEVWSDFASDGALDNIDDPTPSVAGETIGGAVAVTVTVPAGEMREVAFSLAWDMPRVRFGLGTPYLRRYTKFYGSTGDAAPQLAADALLHADEWEAQIEEWQNSILQREDLPLWYKTALFNELYYLVDGGTIWCYPEEGDCPDAEMGRFAYLESHDYRMYNTYDVHFYASFALAYLWPKLELALQRDLAAATLLETEETFTEMYHGKTVRRKVRGSVPHDVGWPDEDPWVRPNGYFVHDVNDWKDLNPKLVLQIYRDYIATGDLQFVKDTWPAVDAAIRRARMFDRDGDGMIENDGFPDQTYDVWSVKGVSAYTGGLWLAALSAGARLAELVGEQGHVAEYRRLYNMGKKVYEEKLWNGRYFHYDSSRSRQHDSIMADQLAGQWYARACGLPTIVDPVQARSALMTVYDWNVQRFNGGLMGAINGMRPNGEVDKTSMQSQEVWTGTTYAVAAAMIQENLCDLGYGTAYGVYHTTYDCTGYWYQTPEAWDTNGNYRAICYMRPLSIWAMQWALDRKWERGGVEAVDERSNGKEELPDASTARETLFETEPENLN